MRTVLDDGQEKKEQALPVLPETTLPLRRSMRKEMMTDPPASVVPRQLKKNSEPKKRKKGAACVVFDESEESEVEESQLADSDYEASVGSDEKKNQDGLDEFELEGIEFGLGVRADRLGQGPNCMSEMEERDEVECGTFSVSDQGNGDAQVDSTCRELIGTKTPALHHGIPEDRDDVEDAEPVPAEAARHKAILGERQVPTIVRVVFSPILGVSSRKQFMMPLHLNDIAMHALSFPPCQREFLRLTRRHCKRQGGERSVTMMAAGFVVPAGTSEQSKTWSPTLDLSQELLSSFFPLSELAEDGIRCHESKAKAVLFSLMAAVLTVGENLVADAIQVKKFLQKHDHVLLFHDRKLSETIEPTPTAIASKHNSGTGYFSFVDGAGALVGKRMHFTTMCDD